jgi:membrane protein YdbS with pleckstrin-like domain
MNTIDSQDHTGSDYLRESTVILVLRLLFLMLLTDGASLLIRFLFFDLNQHFSFSASILLVYGIVVVLLYVFQIFLIINIILKWTNNYYVIDKDQLIHVSGVLTRKEHIIDITNLKSVRINQDILGVLFHYGTVLLTIASPSMKEEIKVPNIYQPHILESALRKYI